jgi:hypothetical protein
MAWHLNLKHGFYSCKVPKKLAKYSNKFGVKDGNRRADLLTTCCADHFLNVIKENSKDDKPKMA